jgi:tellurite methyltransferase
MDDRAKWDGKYASAGEVDEVSPVSFLSENIGRLISMLRRRPRAMDLAAGEGRNSVFLAQRGFRVEAVDISPVGLQRARRRAVMQGVEVQLLAADLSAFAIPVARYDLVVNFFFLQRSLFPAMARALRPGGILIFETYTTRHQLQQARPMRRAFLLEPGELCNAFPTLETLLYEEKGATARLIARAPELEALSHPCS